MTFLAGVYAYFKYNSTRQVAIGLIKFGKENFNIKESSWKTYPFFWSFNMLLSSIKCCCSAMKCCCCSCVDICQTEPENEEQPLIENGQSSTATANYGGLETSRHTVVELLFGNMNDVPDYNKWSSQARENRILPDKARETFNEMLDKCFEISYSNFLTKFQRFASFSLNSHSNFCRHPACKNENHAQFTGCCSLLLKPILYYGVLDWNHLRRKWDLPQDSNRGLYKKQIYSKLILLRKQL